MSQIKFNYDSMCSWLSSNATTLTEDVIVYEEGTSPDICLFRKYSHWINETLGTQSRLRLTRMAMSFLLAQPTLHLLKRVQELKRQLDWQKYRNHIAVQYRAFVDDAPTFAIQQEQFPQFCKHALYIIDSQISLNDTLIWFTSDNAEAWKLFQTKTKLPVKPSPFQPQHTSHMPSDNQIKDPIVEWFLLGESDILLSSGTTFGTFAAGRSNTDIKYFVFDGDTKKFHLKPAKEELCQFHDICF